MSALGDTFLELARNIAARPTMFAPTPDAAHGMLEVVVWAILHAKTREPLGKCMNDAGKLLKEATSDVVNEASFTAMLCDESFPDRRPSFDAFRRHAHVFVKLLEERLLSFKE